MFQIWGHAMQDFARLEAELIYAVMDRQSDSPIERLPALDLTPAQFPLWCALETHLLAHHCSSPLPSIEGTYPTNVSTVLNLVLQVRQAAQSVQTQKKVEGASPDFLDEYLPALLFQTLKIISYDAISPLKRILAVRSAVAILDLIDTRRLDPSSACVQ
jgi:hypothetical protein